MDKNVKNFNWRECKRFHFIGIGGIGMSALARFLDSQEKRITGSDSTDSEVVDGLTKEGIEVFIGHISDNVADNVECVVYTLAIAPDNPEFLQAKKMGIPAFTYAEMLGQVSRDMKTVAVSGTHGKTTTTAMINSALREAGLSPNLIVGSLLSEFHTNFLAGEDDIFVCEACEYKRSFLNLSPTVLVITNIEADHLDYYKDLDDVKSAFMELADKVPTDGAIICDFEDENVTEIIKKYSFAKDGGKCINFRDYVKSVPELFVIGEHNVRNAAAALAVADFLKTDMEGAKKGLAEFKGTWRRLEYRGKNTNGAIIYDDYGHHPTEIQATLTALKQKYPDKKLAVFFQPHLYSRTKTFLNEFIEVLRAADSVFMLPIYAAREPNDPEISSDMIAAKIAGAKSIKSFNDAQNEMAKFGPDYVVLTLGAGDVYLILK